MTKPERKQHIMERLRTAMADIQNDPRYDWTREPSQTVCTTAESLMKAAQKFIDGKLEESDIKPLYKEYVDLYRKAQESN